jgi:AmiR/NasT family two-component response regulator
MAASRGGLAVVESTQAATRSILLVLTRPERRAGVVCTLTPDLEAAEAHNPEEAMRLAEASPRAAALIIGADSALLDLTDRLATEHGVPSVLVVPAGAKRPDIGIHEGVMGALVEPVSPDTLQLTLEVAIRRFQGTMALRKDAEALRRNIEDRKLIERAKGLLMEMAGLSEREAYARIRQKSMDSQRPMVEIARAIILAFEMNGGAAAPVPSR